jgi:pimeloyl-ACP methyl ester carboxylesterase
VLPAQPAYAALFDVLGDRMDGVAKDLELYASDEPPADYSLATEADGILREAEAREFARFHLVGYSGGGAAALSFASDHGDRLLSLALFEPAWAGNERSPKEEALHERFVALERLPPEEQMSEFTRLQLAPGVEPPARPDGPPPPWMAQRPAGIRALIRAFEQGELDLDALRRSAETVDSTSSD